MTANVTQMAYIGATPWHREGTKLTEGADIDTWVREAGLDYEVKKAAVRYVCEGDEQFGVKGFRKFADRFVTYRADDGTALGLVSDRYKIVQPAEVGEFYRDFVDTAGMKLETMGTLLDSRRVFGLASLDHGFTLPGGDVTRPYLLFSTSFDGETSTLGTFTSVRVVCCNTLAMAIREATADKKAKRITGFSVGHSRDFDRAWAQDQVRNLLTATEQYQQKAKLLAATGLSKDEAIEYFVSLVGVIGEDEKLTSQSRAKIDRLVSLYRTGPGADLPSARGTAWGALNAVTCYVDHEAPTRKDNSRFVSGQFGPGAQLKNKALEAALELAVAA